MKKTSQIALGASVIFFLAAGMVKFWPEERFAPRPVLSAASAGVVSPLRVLGPSAQAFPENQGLLPPWLRREPSPQRDSKTPNGNSVSPSAPAALSAKKSATSLSPASTNGAPNAVVSAAPSTTPDKKSVSLAAQNVPVGDVLAQVFKRAGVHYSLPGRLREPVNIIFVDAPLSQALDQTLSLTTKPHLTYHKEDGVYVVIADEPDLPTAAQNPAPSTGLPAAGFRQGAY